MTRQRKALVLVAVAVAYALGSELAFSWFGAGGLGASFFPAAGVTIAALLLTQRKLWPLILLTAGMAEFAVDLLHGVGPLASVGYVVANLAQPLLGAVLIAWIRPAVELARTDGLLAFFSFGVVAAPALGGALGATSFTVLGDGNGWSKFALQWWVGDGLGVLVVGGAILAVAQHVKAAPKRWRYLETVALGAVCVAASAALFWWDVLAAALVLFLLLIVTGFRLGTWAVALIGACVAFIAAEATAGNHGLGQALNLSPSAGVLYLQISLGAVLMSALGIAAEISERERAAEEAGAARRLQEIADAAPAMLWVTDADNHCTFLSRGWYEYTGVDEALDKDRSWPATVHPDDRAAALNGFAEAVTRKEAFTLNYRLQRADGVYRRAIDVGRPRHGLDGAFLGYVGTVIDVDARLRAEEAVQQSESQLRALFASINEGYCVCEVVVNGAGQACDYRFIEVNGVFEAVTGLVDAQGRTARELMPDLEAPFFDRYAEVAFDGQTMKFEQRAEAGRVLDVFATPLEPRGRFALVFTDVTARRQAEAARALEARRDRFRSRLSEQLHDLADPAVIYATAAEQIGAQLSSTQVFFAELHADDRRVSIRGDYGIGLLSRREFTIEELVGERANALRAGHSVVVADTCTLSGPLPALDTGGGSAGLMLVSLMEAKRLVAVLGVLQDAPRQWTAEEVALVEGVGLRTWQVVQRTRSDRSVRESEARFRSLADTVPDLIWLTGPDDRNEFTNAAFSRFIGVPNDELQAMGWTQFVHPDDIEEYLVDFLETARGRGRFEREVRMLHSDGAYRWMRTVAEPRQVDGRYAGYVGSTVDVHDLHLGSERDSLLSHTFESLDREVGVRNRVDRLPQLVVEQGFADQCLVLMIGSVRAPRMLGRAARMTTYEQIIDRLDDLVPLTSDMVGGVSTQLVPEVSETFLRQMSSGDEELGLRRALDLRSVMSAPLTARGRHVGVLWVARCDAARAYTERDLATLLEIASRGAVALDNAALYDAETSTRREAERSRARLGELHRLTTALSGATSTSDVARVATADIVAASGADGGWLVSGTRGGDTLATLATLGYPAELARRFAVIPVDASLPLAECARTGDAMFIETRTELVSRYPDFAELHASPAALALVSLDVGGLGLCFSVPRTFTAFDRAHLIAMGRLTGHALERARRFEEQREISTHLQQSLLPASLPAPGGVSVAGSYTPGTLGTMAGGDWYDAVDLPGGRLAVTVGDVVGHGIAAAAVMGQLRSALRGLLIAGFSPGAAITHLNRFAFSVDGATCASAICFIVETATGRVKWARAGHPPLCVVTSAGPEFRKEVNGTLLGVFDRDDYPQSEFTMPTGAAIIAYSDGLVERRGEDLDLGLDRLALIASRGPRSHAEQVLSAVQGGTLPARGEADDVVVVVVVRHLPASRIQRVAEATNLAVIRAKVREWAAPLGLAPHEYDDLTLALGEAIANCAEHAYHSAPTGVIRVDMTHASDGALTIGVEDDGRWRASDVVTDRGHGLPLMRRLVKDVSVTHRRQGTRIELTFHPQSVATGFPQTAITATEPFATEVKQRGGRQPVLCVRGEVDDASAPQFSETVGDLLSRAGTGGVLDLSDVSYLGSGGIRVIALANQRARRIGNSLTVVVRRHSIAHRVLDVTAVAGDLQVEIRDR